MRHIAGVAAAAATTKSVGAVSLAVFPIFFCPYHPNIRIQEDGKAAATITASLSYKTYS
jgi:hypothetical protein